MKHNKLGFVLGFTSLVLAGSLGMPGPLVAQEPAPQPQSLHPYGKAWEEHRPSAFAKQAVQPATTEAALAVLQPSAFANEHRMVFESYRDNQYEIYAADGDGNGTVRLTTSGLSRFPKLRNGAITMAFTHGSSGSRDLWAVRKDGSALTQLSLAQGYSDAAWSPDGTKLAYARRATTTDVYVSNFDFAANAISGEVCLTCGSGRNNFEPSWSPDGKQLIFVKASTTEPKGALWRMNADGTGQQQVLAEQWWIENVRWSPDGAQVAFDYATARDDWQRLGALTLASGALREVYNPNQDKVDTWMGSWSPDSQMLFFTRVEYVEQGGQLYIGKTWIERVNANGSGRARLPGNSGLDAMPSLQRRDLIAPVSFVQKLDPYSRVSTFALPRVISSDLGGSGLASVEVEYKNPLNGSWTNIWPTINPKTQLFFRSRVSDFEGNLEAWPSNPDYDTSTIFYSYILTGTARDNHGIGLGNVSITTSPVFANAITSTRDGSYRGFLTDQEQNLISLSKIGYSSLPTTTVRTNTDVTFNPYLYPADNLIVDSSFEGGPVFWNAGIGTGFGYTTTYKVDDYSSTGEAYAKFRFNCGILCSVESITLTSNLSDVVVMQTQKIFVPISLTRPTLSFLSRYEIESGRPVDNPIFFASISTNFSTTLLITKPLSLSQKWSPAWIENPKLLNWANQFVTITFGVFNLPKSEVGTIYLDDISLGSWLTPVPTQTNIAQLPANAPAQQITITGTNFIATPTVKLNNSIALSNVQWLTDTQLIADLPANLPIGIYDLWVTNPGGQESVLPNAIKVGRQVYLPLARKED